jgi:hypothetical protein
MKSDFEPPRWEERTVPAGIPSITNVRWVLGDAGDSWSLKLTRGWLICGQGHRSACARDRQGTVKRLDSPILDIQLHSVPDFGQLILSH